MDLRASLRTVVRRARSDTTVLAATAVTVVLATTLLAAGPMYADAVSTSGLRSTLASGSPSEVGIRLVARTSAEDAAAVASSLEGAAVRHLDPWLAVTDRVVVSGSVDLDGLPEAHVATIATATRLEDHVELVGGVWPDAADDRAGEPQAVLHEDAAALAGIAAGDLAGIVRRDGSRTAVLVTGLYRPRDVADPYWWDEPLLRDGVTRGPSFTTVGPLVAPPGDLGFLAARDRTTVTSRSRLDPSLISVRDVRPLRAALASLRRDLDRGPIERPDLRSGLNELLAATDRAVTVTRAAVVLTAVQLAVLAVYALGLAAGLLRSTRVVETALVRARGAEPAQLVRLAVLEGLLLVLPAVVAAPFLAVAGLRVFARAGILAPLDVALDPALTAGAFATAAVAGAVCLVALLLPALRDAVPYATAHAETGREERRPFVQRAGLDLALVAVALLGMWQLARYRSPLAEDLQGRLGVDPLLVAAPALGLLAGAVLTLRLVPLVARLAERAAARRSDLVPALGAWQLGRRPTRTTRSILLLLLAVAIGTFASTYAGTWSRSQQDQADAIVAADLRVSPDLRPGGLAPLSLTGVYADVEGVTAVAPVLETRASLVGGRGQPRLVAVDASAPDALVVRGDVPTTSPARMLEDLRARRTEVPSVALGAPARLAFTATASADGPTAGPAGVSLLLRDERGVVHRAFAGSVPFTGRPEPLSVVVRPEGVPAAPVDLRLLAIEVVVPLLDAAELTAADETDLTVGARIAVEGLGGDGSAIALGGTPWRSSVADVPGSRVAPTVVRSSVGPGNEAVLEVSTGSAQQTLNRSARFTLVPDEVATPAVLPAYVTEAFLTTTAGSVGDLLRMRIEGQEERLHVVGTLTTLPGAPEATDGVLVDLGTLAANRAIRGEPTVPTAWLLATDATAGTGREVARTLTAPPIESAAVASRHVVGRGLSEDPVALGLIGALALGFLAAAGFAGAGYGVTAIVSARERLSEFALLSALGTTAGHVRRWLLLESVAVVVASLLGGVALGLGLAWVVLPAISLSRTGAAVVPAPALVVPWGTLAAVASAGAAVLVVVPLALARLVGRVRVAEALRTGDEA